MTSEGGVFGQDELIKAMNDLEKRISEKLERLFRTWAERLAEKATTLVPDGDNELRDSITHEVKRLESTLIGAYGTNLKRAAQVEFGTTKIQGVPETAPFLRAAWGALHGEFERELAEIGKGFKA